MFSRKIVRKDAFGKNTVLSNCWRLLLNESYCQFAHKELYLELHEVNRSLLQSKCISIDQARVSYETVTYLIFDCKSFAQINSIINNASSDVFEANPGQ